MGNDRFPDYDVLMKRNGPSWNDKTRDVIDGRLTIGPDDHGFFDDEEWSILRAVSARILPQPTDRPDPVPVSALIDRKLYEDRRDGFRDARLPPQREAWKRGLRGLDTESRARHGTQFVRITSREQDNLLRDCQDGRLKGEAWGDMPCDLFFKARLIVDHMNAYYTHPTAWNEIGFGGPASPRGYVRMDYDKRDPWEASEAKPGREEKARRENRRVR